VKLLGARGVEVIVGGGEKARYSGGSKTREESGETRGAEILGFKVQGRV
jgi:hypothetical protein